MTTFTREDFEHADRAAGLRIRLWHDGIPGVTRDDTVSWIWNPPDDDGQALRLAVALHMDFTLSGRHAAVAQAGPYFKQEFCNGDPYAATRYAIFRAAIAIGKAMLAKGG